MIQPLSPVQTLVTLLLPGRWHLQARRNAWAAMSEGTQRARARAEADVALADAVARYAAGQARAAR